MSKGTNNVYQFKITLKGIQPKIWRRIQVPELYTFWDLHIALQDAMGWGDDHLYGFHILNPCTRITDQIVRVADGDEIDSNDVKINQYFSLANKRACYIYDFGDSWVHDILLEKILPAKGNAYPICIAGERACPPEDCGGAWGYEEILEALKDPKNKDYKERIEWLGRDFDPERFNPGAVSFRNNESCS